MPSKKGPQSKDQQPSQSQNQAPPLTATAAAAGKPSQDQSQQMSLLQENADPVSACMSVVDRKVRNLDKRKTRLVTLKEKMSAGEKIEKDQMDAVSKLQSVEEQLEMLKDVQKQLSSLGTEYVKLKKKQQRQEKVQQRDQQREVEKNAVAGTLRLQLVLNSMDDNAKEDFQNGTNGAVRLSEAELEQLDDWYQLINPSRADSEDYSRDIQEATDHVLCYLDKSTKQVNGTTYEELNKLVTKVDESGYFDMGHVGTDDEEEDEFSQEEEEPKEDYGGDESSPEEDEAAEPQSSLQQMGQVLANSVPAQTTAVGLGGKRESPQPTAASTHVPPTVQSHQGMVPSHINYLPGTPSPTFPGLQSTILQTSGDENFPIDFLHESDLRGAEHEQTTKSSSSYVTSHQQQSHEASTDYNYTNATLNMTPADSTVPPIVSPTGELIQPGPSSYSKQALSSQQVTSHSPDFNESSTATTSAGRPLQSNSKPFEDDYRSSAPTYASSSSRKPLDNGGSSSNRNYGTNNNNGNYRTGRGGKGQNMGYRNSGQMVGAPVIDRGGNKPPYQNDYRRPNNNGNYNRNSGRGGQRGGGTSSRRT